ncbi:HU family DNA-binding protein [Ligilactobacillus salivarius]|uniref:DNA-binding protein HU n=4 Tax=Bacilli TaxID=91061 RepID=A0A1V9RC19_9LACO|nr:HU family DNA-binding protein [Ligilactobacillus salivarius]PEH10409.1 HU family DNA-binding protein [Lactobacillus sp. UMNPBX2]AYC11682.1 DNA-binding protein HU [Ligilactobacillus salivarius]MBE5066313.1 HU family DNA-binding protein [Ligilactobacillus salivarius]MBZ4030978.1 HU family DNA-binding protein [Ligilactobacillus salivarius]MDH4960087.1 HU family DNA-binding protein [Ligilactobacillus salivarius]
MNRLELVNTISRKMGATKKDADKAVTAFIDTVTEALVEGRKVQLIGFGTFEVRERAARKGRNPQTGEEIEIPASKIPAFKAGKSLKDSVK